ETAKAAVDRTHQVLDTPLGPDVGLKRLGLHAQLADVVACSLGAGRIRLVIDGDPRPGRRQGNRQPAANAFAGTRDESALAVQFPAHENTSRKRRSAMWGSFSG